MDDAMFKELLESVEQMDAIAQGKAYAEASGEETDLLSFHALLPQWKANGALETDILTRLNCGIEMGVAANSAWAKGWGGIPILKILIFGQENH